MTTAEKRYSFGSVFPCISERRIKMLIGDDCATANYTPKSASAANSSPYFSGDISPQTKPILQYRSSKENRGKSRRDAP
ncbi:MAG TPA: hypothetical protein PKJ84_15185 [Anaerolineales bacterium]|nr:hypothetical protein [Anaerolineales bacterium]